MTAAGRKQLLPARILLLIVGTLFVVTLTTKTSKNDGTRMLRLLSESLPNVVGFGGQPAAGHFPLPRCGGDCDNDAECGEGLICFQREAGHPVPGCNINNHLSSRTDFCVRTVDLVVESAEYTPSPTFDTEILPAIATPTPTWAPTKQPPTEDIIIQGAMSAPTQHDPIPLTYVGNNGRFDAPYPLGPCQADCDSDLDCFGELECFQRDSGEKVPGCLGYDTNIDNDYCHFPPSLLEADTPSSAPAWSPTEQPTAAPTPSRSPTGQPTAEDTAMESPEDSVSPTSTNSPTTSPSFTTSPTEEFNIQEGMIAPTQPPIIGLNPDTPTFEFRGPPTTLAPTTESWGYLMNHTDPVPLTIVGNNGRFDAPYPLGPCQGDCDSDRDCLGELECFQRPQDGERVPGCLTGDESNIDNDYCYFPPALLEEAEEGPVEPWKQGFQLKLYWEEGYTWQNETIERKWCITRNYTGSPVTGKCWYGEESEPCNQTQMYVDRCSRQNNPYPTQLWDFVPVSDDEVLIQAYQENRCFQRDRRNITLATCNATNPKQKWFAIRGGFNEYRFELSQKLQPDWCINQDHHPKPGEVIKMFRCEKIRSPHHETSWWNIY